VAARNLVAAAGVPVAPGTVDPVGTTGSALEAAAGIGVYACGSVSTTVIGATGPKISSRNAGISRVTSASTVGR